MRDIHARVDDRSHRAIIEFATERGVSVSALAEALARWITDNPGAPPRHLEKCIDQVVEDAERIDAERRGRRPR